MAAGIMWALIFITIALRFSPKRLENFNGFNHKASDLGYYASYDLNYLQKCDFTLKALFPVQNKENDAMADHRRRHQITTRNSKNNILHGVTLVSLKLTKIKKIYLILNLKKYLINLYINK